MSNTLPILGVNNTGLTFRLPRWDHRLKYDAGSVVLYDTDSDDDSTNYRLFLNPSTNDVGPFGESEVPVQNPSASNTWLEFDVISS